ncbi:MAG: PAS-domain containing protein [Pseudoxanthomonas suwonensis]|nr:PAS-domain containing protein [Pseudoxanthomonas suwonensis]
MSGWVLLLVSLLYVAVLFTIASIGERHAGGIRPRWRIATYALALAVYCSSWTFYGAVGTAAGSGMGFFAIYLGPILLMLLGWRLLERLVLVSGEQKIVSISDFLSARYGRSPALAALVATVALVAAIPYVALQYKAVGMSVAVLAGTAATPRPLADPALYVAVVLVLFAILYGTRRVDATEHHRGLVWAVALESVVKLVALLSIGALALGHLPGSGGMLARAAEAAPQALEGIRPANFLIQTVLAFIAILCLPRQFHVGVVECLDAADLRPARWLFIGYLLLLSLVVMPIALAGQSLVGTSQQADAYVLALPLQLDHGSLALLAYLGGFSAATGMVIVASVALATMVSNDLVVPALLRSGLLRGADAIERPLLWIRRITIVALALLAFAYHRTQIEQANLAQHGLLAFAAVAQFAPLLLGGLFWRGASRSGALAGLGAGAVLWLYCLMLPALDGGTTAQWVQHGPLGAAWLRPQALFGLEGPDPLVHGVVWSLAANITLFVLVSWRRQPRLAERLAAAPFLDPYHVGPRGGGTGLLGPVPAGDLLALAERVVGERHARAAFLQHATDSGRSWDATQPADRAMLQFTERLLASAVGAASARLAIGGALRGSGMSPDEVVALLDETSHAMRFNRQVLSSTLENIAHAVSVVDAEQRLVTWNQQYQTMFGYPDGMLYVGRPVRDLLLHNADAGRMGEGDVEAMIERRLEHLRRGELHLHERVHPDGRVIRLRGQPVEGGGYVTSFIDITEFRQAEQALREANETLESRVRQRTLEAEAAQQSKLRFLAAVSHDVLQPMNAARLFASAMQDSADPGEQQHLAGRVDASLKAAEDLLEGLLDVSRLDAGALQPVLEDFDVADLLRELAAQYAPIAAQRKLQLRLRVPRMPRPLRSDRRLLRRALQNYIANALRYTRSGGVLLSARMRGDALELAVWDTGPGIPSHHLQDIFEEFRRFDVSVGAERGLGLGLSICQRIAQVLQMRLDVRSRPGRGSRFSILVPAGCLVGEVPVPTASPTSAASSPLRGLRVLCIDNDPEIIAGMHALLQRWQVIVDTAGTVEQALAQLQPPPQVLLVDYHLHDRLDGLQLIATIRGQLRQPRLPAALLTGDGSDSLKAAAREAGCTVLTKPVKPASLRAFLAAHADPD